MVVKRQKYIPDRADIIWINFNPVRGHEQKGKRPACVISPKLYNQKSGLALVCPITSHEKGYPFEVTVSVKNIQGALLVDQLRSIDWIERKVAKVGKVSASTFLEIQEKLKVLIF